MAFVLLIFGAAFILSGFHDNASKLFTLIGGEFSGTPSYGKWLLAILVIGAIGYIKPLKVISDAFLILVLLVLFLSNKGFFANFSKQFGLTNSTMLSADNPPTGNYSMIVSPFAINNLEPKNG